MVDLSKIRDLVKSDKGTIYNEHAVADAVEVMSDFINVTTERLREGDMTFKEIVEYHDYLNTFHEKLVVTKELVEGLNAMMHAIKQVQYQGKGVV